MKRKHNQDSPQPKKKGSFIILLVLLALAFALGASYFGVKNWYENNLKPLSAELSEDKLITIVPGSGASDIANQLEKEDIINNATSFNWYVDRQGVKDQLQAGTYRLSASMSVKEIVDILVSGKVDTSTFTILPGLRLDEIQKAFAEAGFDKNDIQKAFEKSYKHPLLKTKPNNASLEGYIFPETHLINSQVTPEQIIGHSLDLFYSQITPEMLEGIKDQGLTLHEAIILASIVQKESAKPGEQAKIAQVFLKRLDVGMPLGADPTFIYAARIAGLEPAVDIDSPYNTRIYKSLPPGPIANFNITALKAVANPSDTNYLYFVAGDDGTTYFSETFEQHEEYRQKYCKQACQLPE